MIINWISLLNNYTLDYHPNYEFLNITKEYQHNWPHNFIICPLTLRSKSNDIFHHIAYCVDISHISKYFRWNIVIWLANTWHKYRYFRLKKCKFIKGSSSSHGVSVLTCGGSLWPNLIDETIEMSECDVLKYFYGVIWP